MTSLRRSETPVATKLLEEVKLSLDKNSTDAKLVSRFSKFESGPCYNPNCSCYFSKLSDFVLLFEVLPYLELRDLLMLEAVCKRLKHLSTHKILWEKVNFRRFPFLLQNPGYLSNFLQKRPIVKTVTLCDLDKVMEPASVEVLSEKLQSVKTLKMCNIGKVSSIHFR